MLEVTGTDCDEGQDGGSHSGGLSTRLFLSWATGLFSRCISHMKPSLISHNFGLMYINALYLLYSLCIVIFQVLTFFLIGKLFSRIWFRFCMGESDWMGSLYPTISCGRPETSLRMLPLDCWSRRRRRHKSSHGTAGAGRRRSNPPE